MTQKASAATQRRSIGRQLKAARAMYFPDRAKKELPLAEAAAALHVNQRTIRRLEGGEVKPNYLLVQAACAFYGLEAEATRRLLEMVEQADEDEWHEKYRQDISRGWSSFWIWRRWPTASMCSAPTSPAGARLPPMQLPWPPATRTTSRILTTPAAWPRSASVGPRTSLTARVSSFRWSSTKLP